MIDGGQLPLGLRWPPQQSFDYFVAAGNALALAACQHAANETGAPWVVLLGTRGSGKTHLLLAACQQASRAELGAQYLPLRDLPEPRAAAIRGGGGRALIAVDDVDAIKGDSDAEHALFELYNRRRDTGETVLFSASQPLASSGLQLPDLLSRLGMCTQLALQPLDEAARRSLLRERAAARGMSLEDDVLDWLFRHHPRDMTSLSALLEKLDHASLAAHRRITIPFLRDFLRR
ncbi:MAG: DnaA regulatory inactivator Hda [Xanthomonadales bacterium]|nr:DnaA regulatory inactivator Hda [Xanthomonadales bacterium]